MSHRYREGQTVYLARNNANPQAANGAYKVIRTMPTNGVALQYRVKSELERHERVISESDILRG